MIEYFWLEGVAEKLAHITARTDIEETPTGTDGDVCVGYCGKKQEAWYHQGCPEPFRGDIEDVIKARIDICEECFRIYAQSTKR